MSKSLIPILHKRACALRSLPRQFSTRMTLSVRCWGANRTSLSYSIVVSIPFNLHTQSHVRADAVIPNLSTLFMREIAKYLSVTLVHKLEWSQDIQIHIHSSRLNLRECVRYPAARFYYWHQSLHKYTPHQRPQIYKKLPIYFCAPTLKIRY